MGIGAARARCRWIIVATPPAYYAIQLFTRWPGAKYLSIAFSAIFGGSLSLFTRFSMRYGRTRTTANKSGGFTIKKADEMSYA